MRIVTAFNGARDNYEVPLAIHELGLLERHVSHFYLPDLIGGATARLPNLRINNRRRAGLPSNKVSVARHALMAQTPIVRRLYPPARPFEHVHAALAGKALEIASRNEAVLILFEGIAHHAFERTHALPRWLYQYHPHPAYVQELLAADAARYGEIQHSFRTESDSNPSLRDPDARDECLMADTIFCASTFTARSLVSHGAAQDRIRIVPYGAEIGPPPPDVPSRRHSTAKFLFVGQGVQRKGLHHLLRAWKLAGLPDAELTVVARRLDPGLMPHLDQATVRHVHDLTRSALRRLFAESDVFVMPSLVEGFGLVYLEALASGLYCIGTRNTGLPDLRLPASSCDLVEVGDIEALSRSLVAAHARWLHGELDKAAIAADAGQWTWHRHREHLKASISDLVGRL